MGEQTKPTVEDVARNCPSTCIFPFNSWLFTGEVVDVTAPGCWQCKELAEAVKRGEVQIPGADKIQKLLDKVRKEIGDSEPSLYVPDVELIVDPDGKIETRIKGVAILTPDGIIRYIKADD